jgi:uncharacterized protein YlxW (UPF0749 family)
MTTPRADRRGASSGARMLTDLLTNHLDPGYAAAARRRAEDGPQPRGRRGLRKAAAVTGTLLIGIVLAVAYREAVATAPESARTRAALLQEVEQRSARTDEYQGRAEALRRQVVRDRTALLEGTSAGSVASARVRDLEAATGLGTVRGPGVVVTLADGPAPEDPVTGEKIGEPDLARVQDRDLQDVVNALWASGAEAVSVNGQRLATTSAIRSAGGAVLVDFRPVHSPYHVRAIGNPERVRANFDSSGAARRFRGYEQQYGMTFSTQREAKLELAAAPPPELRHAEPLAATPSHTAGSPAAAGGSDAANQRSAVPSPSGGGR